MRHAVLAAAVAFNPRHAWTRRPLQLAARRAGQLILAALDRRRAVVDEASPA